MRVDVAAGPFARRDPINSNASDMWRRSPLLDELRAAARAAVGSR